MLKLGEGKGSWLSLPEGDYNFSAHLSGKEFASDHNDEQDHIWINTA